MIDMKMSSAEKTFALNVIEKFIHMGFVKGFYEARKANRDIYHWFIETNLCEAGYDYACGETKGVFFIPGLDNWVLKITTPYETEHDWCGREYENFIAAEEEGLGRYFAAMELLTEIDGIKFYAQEKLQMTADVDGALVDILEYEYQEREKPYDRDQLWEEVEDLDACDRVELLFENRRLRSFVDCRRINDLHCDNFGCRGVEGEIVILDYSGYGSRVWEV